MGKCSKQLFTPKCKPGGKFADAMTSTGKIDTHDPVVQEWLNKRENVIDPKELKLKQYEKMTVLDITESYGSIDELEGFMKTQKLIVETEHKKIQMEATREELVSRENVGKACFGLVNTAHLKLLDMPTGVLASIAAILETKEPGAMEEAEKLLTEEISKILTDARDGLIERLGDEITN